ncbi:hypothetical protein Tco_1118478 [Tanacetum coccineum]
MDICVVSVDEDGERGGAPVLCIKDAMRQCSEFSRGQLELEKIDQLSNCRMLSSKQSEGLKLLNDDHVSDNYITWIFL